MDAQCPSWAAGLGYMGVAAAVCLSNTGSAVSARSRGFFALRSRVAGVHIEVGAPSVLVLTLYYDTLATALSHPHPRASVLGPPRRWEHGRQELVSSTQESVIRPQS
jgi:hypothetical protein